MIGKQISHYKIVKKLGDGGMGTVYKAYDLRLLRFVAIKILRSKLVISVNKRLRFIKEAQTASSLNHPNICTIHDINEFNNQNFIVMEFVDGRTLREILNERKQIPNKELLNIAIKISEALSAVHAKGISHRDIKPENIMITNKGLVKIMDFGLAKLASDLVESKLENIEKKKWQKDYLDSVVLTNFSGLLGTVHYMSPEQARGKSIDPRSDIFSLGTMLFELLTGEKPFDGTTNLEILTNIISEKTIPDFTSDKISEKMNPILSKSLEKVITSRYQTVDELLLDLKQYKNITLSTPIKKLKRTVVIGGLVVVAIIILFTLYLKQNKINNFPKIQTTQFTNYTGIEKDPVISPDGTKVAFSWGGPEQNNVDVYVKNIDGSNLFRLTNHHQGEINPKWSGDGKLIAFARQTSGIGNKYDLYTIPSNGGKEQKITSFRSLDSHSLNWSKDNKNIYFQGYSMKELGFAIFKVSIETKEIQQVTFPKKEDVSDFTPSESPDGKKLSYLKRLVGGKYEIYVLNLETNNTQIVPVKETQIDGITWGEDSNTILFAANLDGSSALWKTDLAGKNLEKLFSDISIFYPYYSPVGHSIVYRKNISSVGIWKLDLKNPSIENLLVGSSVYQNINPKISPDGNKLIFSTNRTGSYNFWECNINGKEQKQITFLENKTRAGYAQWSPSNDEILIYFEGSDLYVLDYYNGNFSEFNGIGNDPTWTSDGRGFYVSDHITLKLYRVSKDGKNKIPVTRKTGFFAIPHEQYVYYIKNYNPKDIWRIDINQNKEEPVIQGYTIGTKAWEIVSEGIYFKSFKQRIPSLFFYEFKSKEISFIKQLPNSIGSIDIAPNEEYMLYAKKEASWDDIVLVSNVYFD